jgi:dCTP deaminase
MRTETASGGQSGYLVRKSLERLIADGLISQETFSTECLGPWTYDLRLGKEVYISSDKTLTKLQDGDSIVIEPGEFALLMTWERLNVPQSHVAFISLRFSHALKGLVNISGFHVDPGFRGHIVFSVYNAGPRPVVLRSGEKVFMLVVADLDGKAEGRPSAATFQDLTQLKSEWIAAVKGPPVSLVALNTRLERLTWRVNSLLTLAGGILLALFASLLTLILR